MVQDARETPHTGRLRSLRTPTPTSVKIDGQGKPLAVKTRNWHTVTSIEDRWRINDEWWRKPPVSRTYFRLHLDNGTQLTLFQDLTTGRWFRQSYD